jgi:hypothetical protein
MFLFEWYRNVAAGYTGKGGRLWLRRLLDTTLSGSTVEPYRLDLGCCMWS